MKKLTSFKKQISYCQHLHNRDFIHAFACLPKTQWTATSKRRWICARLGLFDILLNIGWNGKQLRSGVAYAQALSAYGKLIECQQVLNQLVNKPDFSRFQNELINEFSKYNPHLALQLIDTIPFDMRSPLHHALHLSFTLPTSSLNQRDIKHLYHLYTTENHPELSLLMSNISDVSIDFGINLRNKINLLNNYQNYYYLPSLQLIHTDLSLNSCNLELTKPLPHHSLSVSTHKTNTTSHKVSILVTMYNSAQYIESTLTSLLNQTWKNIEVILIDDMSDDNSIEIAQAIANQDSRITVLRQHKNTGTYIAKTNGLEQATGEFVICHDSDDWAHPLKIELQVMPFFMNKNLKGTTSDWIKVDENGYYYVRQGFPFKRKNPSSLMFRRKQTIKDLGYLWENVRTGADSEFFERFKLTYGNHCIKHISKPLTIGSHRTTSLMNDEKTGTKNIQSRIQRLQYWESWRIKHIEMARI